MQTDEQWHSRVDVFVQDEDHFDLVAETIARAWEAASPDDLSGLAVALASVLGQFGRYLSPAERVFVAKAMQGEARRLEIGAETLQ
jgi:hypothetical protein